MKSYKRPANPFDCETASTASPHADDTDRGKFILTSNSININCYYKYNQLRWEFPDCPEVRDSTDVIRFEVQCPYSKVYYMQKAIKERDGFTDIFTEMLSDDISASKIVYYFNEIVKPGGYYSMDEAVKQIQTRSFHPKKEFRLIGALKEVAMRGSIAVVREALTKPEIIEDFRRSLRELAGIKVNPVTIPEEYGIAHIPNLLDTYYTKVAEEREEERKADAKLEMPEFGRKSFKRKKIRLG